MAQFSTAYLRAHESGPPVIVGRATTHGPLVIEVAEWVPVPTEQLYREQIERFCWVAKEGTPEATNFMRLLWVMGMLADTFGLYLYKPPGVRDRASRRSGIL